MTAAYSFTQTFNQKISQPDAWDVAGGSNTGADQFFAQLGRLAKQIQDGTLAASDAQAVKALLQKFSDGVNRVNGWIAESGGVAGSADDAKFANRFKGLAAEVNLLMQRISFSADEIAAGNSSGTQKFLTNASQMLKNVGGLLGLMQIGEVLWQEGLTDTGVVTVGMFTAFGAPGNDVLMGGLGADTLKGGAGRDVIYGSSTGSLFYPTSVDYELNETSLPISLGRGFSWHMSTYGPDAEGFDGGHLTWTVSRDLQFDDDGNVIEGGTGNDVIFAGTGNDIAHGGDDRDEIFGMGGSDALYGDGGDDRISGDSHANFVERSVIWAPADQPGSDYIDGGAGNDILLGQGGNDRAYAA
jgi:Ca2+-binding RTX toxin-like protein